MKSARSTCLSFLVFLFAVPRSPSRRARMLGKSLIQRQSHRRPIRMRGPFQLMISTSRGVFPARPGLPTAKRSPSPRNISGRSNLWKVNADGGWPIQLAQSDERQYGETWSPTAMDGLSSRTPGGNELWDVLVIPSDGAK